MSFFNKYKFSNKSQSLGGVLSTLTGLGALACFSAGVYISFKKSGYAGLEVGALGLLTLMLSVIGTIIGLLSFKEDDKFYTLSWLGSLLGGIMTVLMLAVIFMGLGF